MYRISEYLTPSERMDAARLGGLRKLACLGMKPSDLGPAMRKSAQAASLSMLGTALRTSIMIGAPFGVVWYAMKNSLKNDTLKTKKLKAKLDHYNDVSYDMKRQLNGGEEEED